MAERLPPLNALRAFETTARHLSFKKAAEELHVTPAAVSHQVKALEEYLGVLLFRRLTRAIELTDAAEALLPKVRQGFDCFAAGLSQARRVEGRGRISVAAPPNFTARWLMPRLQRFTSSFPQIDLRVTGTLRMIDSAEHDEPREPVRADDEAHVAIRYGTGDYPGSIVDLLFRPTYVPVCSPRLLEKGPALGVPHDLAGHALIHDDSSPGDEERPGWEEWLRFAGVQGVDASRGPRFSNASLVHEAAIDGLGVALALRPLVDHDIDEGRLVVPFSYEAPTRFAYYLVMPEVLAAHPAAESFRAWLKAEAAGQKRETKRRG